MAGPIDETDRRRVRAPTAVQAGLGTAGITAAAYLPGINRSLTYDAAETVGFFVLAPDPFDALRSQRAFNNHPLFSFLENLIVRVAGHSDEWLLRILPIACGAAAVGVLVWAVHRRLGPLPGLAAGAVLAANPMFVEHSRDVRGYSLMVLAAIVATVLYLHLRRAESRNARIGYVVAVCVGLFTHLFMAAVVLAHLVDLGWRRAIDRRWLTTLGAAGVLTLTFYGRMIDDLLGAGESRGRIFRPGFPVDLVQELLGHGPVAVVTLGSAAALGLHALRRSSTLRAFASATLVVMVISWLVAPENLAPRFFVWLVPAVAVIAARSTAGDRGRLPALALIAVAVLASIASYPDGYTDSRNAYPEVAAIIDSAGVAGATVCVTDLSVPPTLAYTSAFDAVVDPDDLTRCDVVAVAEPGLDADLVDAAQRIFAFRLDLPAREPAIVFSRQPIESGQVG